ncbi:MAG: nucleotidyltransferase family protein [Gemmatimonadales bacterium]
MKAGTLLCATLRPDAEQRLEELARVWAAPPAGTAELIRHEGAGLWVHRRLTALGLREQVEPALRTSLRQEVLVTAGTNLRVDEEARRAVRQLREAGIAVILIKGAARRALASRWPLLDARALADVDLLVPPTQLQEAWDCLCATGYELAEPDRDFSYEKHHHLAPLMGPGAVSVELHRSSSFTLPGERAWARFESSAEPVSWQGEPVLVPSATELAWHTISHAVTDGRSGFRLRHWLDVAALLAGGAPVDWAVIRERLASQPIPSFRSLEPIPESVPRQWLGALVALVPEEASRAWAALTVPVDLERLLNGRGRYLSWQRRRPRLAQRMMWEWTPAMLGWPHDSLPESVWHRARWRIGSVAARGAARVMNL